MIMENVKKINALPETIKSFATGAAYIRVSTGKQEELSPDSQKRLILEYAEQHRIFIPPEFIFFEKGISGRKADKRPQFQAMIAKAKAGSFDVILLWKFSRFARNQEESIVYKSMLKKCGVEVVSISEPLADGPFGSLIERIIEWMDEFYSIRLSGDVFRGMTEKAMRGGYQCRPPLGYSIPYHNSPPVIVPEEAEIVRYIFHEYVDHFGTFSQIANKLNRLGLKTARGNSFEKRAVRYILENPCYGGYTRWNRTDHGQGVLKDQNEWIIRPGSHPSIISKELFEAAAARLSAEKPPKSDSPAPRDRPPYSCRHWLSGILKCSCCGRTLTFCTRTCKERTYHSFQCCGYTKGLCSHSHSVSLERVTAAVLCSIRDVEALETSPVLILPDSQGLKVSIVLKKQLDQIDKRLDRLTRAYLAEVYSLEELDAAKNKLDQEKASVQNQLDHITKAVSEGVSLLPQCPLTLSQLLVSNAYTEEQKNTALRSVVEKIIYHKEDSIIEVFYRLRLQP